MIAITFDTDHMTEQSMKTFLGAFDLPGGATFFCTRPYESLGPGDDRSIHEIAIHPFLGPSDDWVATTKKLADSVGGDIKGVRAHSCAFSQQYAVELAKMGYEYVSQSSWLYYPRLKPHLHPWGIWELPIYYMDNMDYEMRELLGEGHVPYRQEIIDAAVHAPDHLFVFDFHPVHLLNGTVDRASYRHWVDKGRPDFVEVGAEQGAAVFFRSLTDAMRKANVASVRLRDIATECKTNGILQCG